MKQKK